jgi:hypothetical protein
MVIPNLTLSRFFDCCLSAALKVLIVQIFAASMILAANGQNIVVCREIEDEVIRGFVPKIASGQFSVSLRATLIGPGSRAEQMVRTGMLFSCGSGWHDGFRAFYDWNSSAVVFQIGRAKEKSGIEVRSSKPVYPGVMHEIICVYDGTSLRLFIDGRLQGERAHVGPVDVRSATLDVGFKGFGIGNNRMFVDTLEFVSRALTLDEVSTHFRSFPPDERAALDALNDFMPSVRSINMSMTDESYLLLMQRQELEADLRRTVTDAYWQRLCADGRFDAAAPLVQAATRRVIQSDAAADRKDAPTLMNRRIEQVIALRAALPRLPHSADNDSLSQSLDQQFSSRLAFRGQLARARKEAGDRVRTLEPRCLGELARQMTPSTPGSQTIFLSPDGDDRNAGTRIAPLRTLQRAVDLAKQIRRQSPRTSLIVIEAAAGDYYCEHATNFGGLSGVLVRGPRPKAESDRGARGVESRTHPVRSARFSGAVQLTKWSAVRDPSVRSRLSQDVRDTVLQCDLKEAGITMLSPIGPRGFGRSGLWVDLHVNGEPLTLARWPDQGQELQISGTAEGKSRFHYQGDRPSRWRLSSDIAQDDIWVSGLWEYEWASQTVPVLSLDQTQRLLEIDHPAVSSSFGFHFLNVLEELDRPGEFYLDRRAGVLYALFPKESANADLRNQVIELSVLEDPIVRVMQCDNITFENVEFSGCRGDAVIVEDSRRVYLQSCELNGVGKTAATIVGGSFCGLFHCRLYSIGGCGVRLQGGNRATLEPSGHAVHDCRIENFSRIDRCYTPAVSSSGCGMVISNNTISRSPHHAVRLDGNDQLVARNEIHDVVLEFSDQAAIDVFCDPTYQGIVLERNFLHDVGGPFVVSGHAGIRLDDAISGVLISENVFYRCSAGSFGAIHVNGGKDNVCVANTFIDCKTACSFSAWHATRFEQFARERFSTFLNSPLYEKTYPFMKTILQGAASRNFVVGNEAFGCERFQARGDENVFIGNRWQRSALPEGSHAGPTALWQAIQQISGRPLGDVGTAVD